MNAQVPTMPVLFSKYNTALNHQGGSVSVAGVDAKQFDYEAELVIVIGRRRATSARPTRPSTSSATAPATTSPPATCSGGRASG